jgi:crotonobetainyl-CoA:carnitine CoA-transferase CaiB-like acyl-CoA transferase
LHYRILDLTDEKGFLCGKMFGDLGADVIKIEQAGGDRSRLIGPFYHDIPDPEKSLYWFAYNTSKRGITLNLECHEGQDIFRKLVKTADCVIESFDPGYLDQLGLGYAALNEVNPQIIVTSITPFGQKGINKNNKACDLTIQGMSGMLSCNGQYDISCFLMAGAETRQAYLQAGAQAAVATSIALWGRHTLKQGQHIDVPIAESMFWGAWAPRPVLCYEFEKTIFKRRGELVTYGRSVDFRDSFKCKDGYVFSEVYVGGQGHYTTRLVEWMDNEGMSEDLKDMDWPGIDGREDVSREKLDHWEAVIGKFFLTHTREELTRAAVERGFFLFPVNNPHDLLQNNQLLSRNYFVNVSHPELHDSLIYPGSPYKSTVNQPQIRFRAPLIGEHNKEIYGELGITEQNLVMLKQTGVI